MSIEAVFFDMGGTIETYWYDRQFRLNKTNDLQKLLLQFGIDLKLSDSDLYDLINNRLDKYKKFAIQTMIELPSERVWKEYILSDYPQFFPNLDLHGEELMLWIDLNFYERTLRPEVPSVLCKIKEMNLKIGMISNICSLGQVPENLKRYGIIDYFDPIVTSSQYHRRKPDPAIFHRAAFLAKVPTSKCAYIGDRILRDVIGAKKAGFGLVVQIKHDFDHGEIDEGAQPDAVISSMDELVDLIHKQDSTPLNEIQPRLRALLFDAGDILYYRPRRGMRFKEFLENNQINNPPDSTFRNRIKELAYQGEISREEYLVKLVEAYGISDPAVIREGAQILADADNDITFFDGVRETLIALKEKGFMLGIITDSAVPVYLKLSWFDKGGFVDVWDSYISSQEIGAQKPAPGMYWAGMNQLGTTPEESAFIGHNSDELIGAKTVGMTTIAFNPDNGAQADYVVTNFNDLLDLAPIKFQSQGF